MSTATPVPEAAFEHQCEVCGRIETLTPTAAFSAGWDYPPSTGRFGIVSARTCGSCSLKDTAWYALVFKRTPSDQLDERHRATVQRILAEVGPRSAGSARGA